MGGGLCASRYTLIIINTESELKYFLVILILLFPIKQSYSQLVSNYGLKIGLSYSNIDKQYSDSKLNDETNFKLGLGISLFTESSLFKNLNLISEICYIQKGYTENIAQANEKGENIGTFTLKERFDYLTIKLQPSYQFELKSLTPYVFIGPKLDIKLNNQDENNYLFKFLKNNQFGISYGAGIKLNKIIYYPILLEINSNYDFGYSFSNYYLKVRNLSYELKFGIEL